MTIKNDRKIEEEVKQTLRALDGIQRAVTDDYFYDRLAQRLKNRNEHPGSVILTPKLVFAVAAALVLIFFNVLTVLEYRNTYGDDQATRQQNLEAFAQEYQLEIPDIYDLNSEE